MIADLYIAITVTALTWIFLTILYNTTLDQNQDLDPEWERWYQYLEEDHE